MSEAGRSGIWPARWTRELTWARGQFVLTERGRRFFTEIAKREQGVSESRVRPNDSSDIIEEWYLELLWHSR